MLLGTDRVLFFPLFLWPFCAIQGNAMATDENGADDRAGGESTVDHLRSHMNYGDMDLSGEEHVPKVNYSSPRIAASPLQNPVRFLCA